MYLSEYVECDCLADNGKHLAHPNALCPFSPAAATGEEGTTEGTRTTDGGDTYSSGGDRSPRDDDDELDGSGEIVDGDADADNAGDGQGSEEGDGSVESELAVAPPREWTADETAAVVAADVPSSAPRLLPTAQVRLAVF